MKIICLAGWSYFPNVFKVFEKRANCTWLALDWQHVLDSDLIKKEIEKGPCVLLGWSLGGFLLYPFMKLTNVKGGVFIATGPTFVKSSFNPYGREIQEIENMMMAVEKSPSTVVKQFQRVSGLVTTEANQVMEKNKLLEGLEYLRKVEAPCWSLNKKHYLVHGKQDKILDWRSSLMLAKQPGAIGQFFEAGHNVFDDVDSIFRLLSEFE